MVRRFVPVGNAATVAQVLAEIPPERLTLVAERLLERLNERLDPPLPAGEAYALAMHLFHACAGAAGMEETFAHSALIRRVFDLLSHDARIRTRFRRRCQVRRPSALFLRPGPRRPGARRTRPLGGGDARGAGTRRP